MTTANNVLGQTFYDKKDFLLTNTKAGTFRVCNYHIGLH